MHILLICNTLALGGAEKYLIELANQLVAKGHRVSLAFEGKVHHRPGLDPAVTKVPIQLSNGASKGVMRLFHDSKNFLTLYRYIKKEKVDVVNTVLVASGVWGWMSGFAAGIPVVHTPMHVFDNSMPTNRFLFTNKIMKMGLLRALSLEFIAWSNFFEWELRGILGKQAKIHLAPLSIDGKAWQPGAPDLALKRSLGLKDGPVLGCIGGLRLEKGHDKILSSMPSILKRCPDAQLMIVGDGVRRDFLEGMVKKLGIQESVVFAGFRTDTVALTNLMDVYIQATDGPNLGYSSLQAIAQGKPVVTYARSDLEWRMAEDNVEHGANGYIVYTDDFDKAGTTIGELLTSPETLEKMGKHSRRFAEKNFMKTSHVSHVIQVYRTVTQS